MFRNLETRIFAVSIAFAVLYMAAPKLVPPDILRVFTQGYGFLIPMALFTGGIVATASGYFRRQKQRGDALDAFARQNGLSFSSNVPLSDTEESMAFFPQEVFLSRTLATNPLAEYLTRAGRQYSTLLAMASGKYEGARLLAFEFRQSAADEGGPDACVLAIALRVESLATCNYRLRPATWWSRLREKSVPTEYAAHLKTRYQFETDGSKAAKILPEAFQVFLAAQYPRVSLEASRGWLILGRGRLPWNDRDIPLFASTLRALARELA